MAATVRQPFGELSSSRVQQLASAKNRQNGFIARSSPLSAKPMTPSMLPAKTTSKRSYTLSVYDDMDSENVDPSTFSPAKKAKSNISEKSLMKFSFAPASSTPPQSFLPARLSTPVKAKTASPRTPLTAPAGRSPGRKIAGISKNRRVSAPFTRIDPPFACRSTSSLPFSLDAALNSTLSTPVTPAKATIQQDAMPSNWDFEIYEDAPGEEAANLMEHSTLVLDLGSDDELTRAKREDRGKENTPPDGYDASYASRSPATGAEHALPAPRRVKKTELVRRKTAEMDDGERSPLSDLDAEPFIPEGLSKDSVTIVDASTEKTKPEVKSLFATPPPKLTITDTTRENIPADGVPFQPSSVRSRADDTIAIFEDDAEITNESLATVAENVEPTSGKNQQADGDENAAPNADCIS